MASPTDISNLYAWYEGEVGIYDAVSGGNLVTADAGAIARWEDQSGNARHLTQSTSDNRPIYDALKGLTVSALSGLQWFACPASFTLDRRDFSVFAVIELTSLRRSIDGTTTQQYHFMTLSTSNANNLHYDGDVGKLSSYDGSFHDTTTIPLTTVRCLIGWVGNSSNLVCWLDGVSTTGSVLGSGNGTLTHFLGQSSSTHTLQAGVRDLIVYSKAVSSTEVADTLFPYAQQRGVSATRLGQLVCDGDSITQGYQSTVNRTWPAKALVNPTCRIRVTAQSGITINTLKSQRVARVDALLVGGETNLLCIFAGTNDLELGGSAAAVYGDISGYCSDAQTAGFKVAVFTILPRSSFDATKEARRVTVNSDIVSDWATFADYLVDCAADSRLDDYTDTTYFNADGIHLNDTGLGVLATLVQPAITAEGLYTAPSVSLFMNSYRQRRVG